MNVATAFRREYEHCITAVVFLGAAVFAIRLNNERISRSIFI